MSTKRRKIQPLDRIAPLAIGILSVLIVVMTFAGAQALPKVRSFSWADQTVSADNIGFILDFTQPMDARSVEENLQIEPELAGKISWAGRRMAYTLQAPAPYGETFKISLPTADALNKQTGFEPFNDSFSTRDRVFAYIGAEGEEQGRLVIFNISKKEKTLLTPANQTVMDFEPYPERDRILFSAVKNNEDIDRVAATQLYTVSTGLATASAPPRWQIWRRRTAPKDAGTIQLVLSNENYQNLKFDLSPNGETIVVQRVNQEDPSDFGPWVISEDGEPRKLKTEPGGDFRIAPDGVSLLLQQGKGTAVIALEDDLSAQEDSELLDFLPEYGLTLDIANDGSAAALVNFNQDDPEKRFTQSLFWVSNQGEEKQLLQTDGAILNAQFNDDNTLLYCLVNRLIPEGKTGSEEGAPAEEESTTTIESTESEDLKGSSGFHREYQIIPYLTAINVDTGEEQKLLEMPPQPEITVSLSPDGLAILFDEALVSDARNVSGYDGPTHRLWLLPVFGTEEARLNDQPMALPPTKLDISGKHPTWLP